MRRVSILASLRRHAAVSCLILAVLLAAAAAGVTASTAGASAANVSAANVSAANVSAANANAPLKRLNDNNGRVLEHPEIHNLYMSRSWDSDNPAGLSSKAIDDSTDALVSSDYFAAAKQYRVGAPTFSHSHSPNAICPTPILDGVTEASSIIAWVLCEAQPGPDPFVRPTLTGIPTPDDNTLYVLYLPVGVQINDLVKKSCDDFAAYHANAVVPAWHVTTVFGVPVFASISPQDFAFAVVPADCARETSHQVTLDRVTTNASHEIIEAATDPDVGLSWIDDSKLGLNGNIFTKGEAGDICEQGEGDAPTPPTRLKNGLLVAPYWSNAQGQCEPITRQIILGEFGLPDSVPHVATFDGASINLPFGTVIDDGSAHSYSFPLTVNDPSPGIRYLTTETAASIDGTKDVDVIANYDKQYFLTVRTTPPAAATGNASLTPSAWITSGKTVNLATDPLVVGDTGNRYRFDHWSDDAAGTDPTTTIKMDAPKTATANYALQHQLVVNTSGLDANSTTIANGTTILGTASAATPLVVWVDDGPLALSASANVNGVDGTQYFSQGFTPAAPTTLTAPFTTTAAYETMAQLVADAIASGGITGPGASGLATSYTQEFAAVQADMAGHHYAQGLSDLQSFISHVQAQAGNHVTTGTAQTFQLDTLLVYHNAICLAATAGQINPATAAADYTFYSSLVGHLGGTVLPPC